MKLLFTGMCSGVCLFAKRLEEGKSPAGRGSQTGVITAVGGATRRVDRRPGLEGACMFQRIARPQAVQYP